MTSVVQQLTVLAGVVIGALASYLATSTTERARWRRQQAARWDDKRAEVYTEYGYAVKNVYMACLRIAESRGLDIRMHPMHAGQTLEDLDLLATERTAKWESVLLLGNPETIRAARIWHRNIWHMQLVAHGSSIAEETWSALLAEVDDARARFYEAARRDLGITSGQVPRAGSGSRGTCSRRARRNHQSQKSMQTSIAWPSDQFAMVTST